MDYGLNCPHLHEERCDLLYEQDGVTVFKRVNQGETSVVAINNTTETQTVAILAEKLEDGADNKELGVCLTVTLFAIRISNIR